MNPKLNKLVISLNLKGLFLYNYELTKIVISPNFKLNILLEIFFITFELNKIIIHSNCNF